MKTQSTSVVVILQVIMINGRYTKRGLPAQWLSSEIKLRAPTALGMVEHPEQTSELIIEPEWN